MLITYSALLRKKLEFLLGRSLSPSECLNLKKRIKNGCNFEIKKALNDLDLDIHNKFEAPYVVIAQYTKNKDLSKLSKEEIIQILEDIVVRTTSVQTGLKILKKVGSMSKNALLKYIFNFYLHDLKRREKKARDAIISDQSNRPPMSENVAAPFAFENPVKDYRLLPLDEYDSNDEYLANEFKNRPLHNERKNKSLQKQIHNYIKNFIGKPTGGKEDVGNQKN